MQLNILLHALNGNNKAEGQLGWKKPITNLPLFRVAFIEFTAPQYKNDDNGDDDFY